MPRKIQLSEPPPRLPSTVRETVPLGDGVYRIRFTSPGFSWRPGDCIAVYRDEESGISRPYSLCGAVDGEDLEIWVRKFPGGEVSGGLCETRAGDHLLISPPFGWFRPGEPAGLDKIYFATGTGIAPFLSAFRSGCAPPRLLYWGLRRPLENFRPDPGLPLTLKCSRYGSDPGRITGDLSQITFTEHTHFYACGLDRMIEQVLGYFADRGVEESRLHRECFFTSG